MASISTAFDVNSVQDVRVKTTELKEPGEIKREPGELKAVVMHLRESTEMLCKTIEPALRETNKVPPSSDAGKSGYMSPLARELYDLHRDIGFILRMILDAIDRCEL